jgi:hypothetical protein
MFAILVSAAMKVFGWLLGSVVIKFVVLTALFIIVNEFGTLVSGFMPSLGPLSTALGGIPASVWYFLDLFNVSTGIPMLLSAYASRFIIRRIPVIG